jgi:hypothetical protein
MSYNTIALCADDEALLARITACAAQEDAYDPTLAAYNMRWDISTASDVEAAYASALAADNPNPGGDEGVITDGMILSNVQANWEGTPGTVPPGMVPVP